MPRYLTRGMGEVGTSGQDWKNEVWLRKKVQEEKWSVSTGEKETEENTGSRHQEPSHRQMISLSCWSEAQLGKEMDHVDINYSWLKTSQSLRYLHQDWSLCTLCWFMGYIITQATLKTVYMGNTLDFFFFILLISFPASELCMSMS